MFRHKKVTAFVAGLFVSTVLLVNSAYAASYTVVANDSLYKIGTVFNTPASTIMSDNGLKSTVLNVGQVLSVRAGSYTVKSGDTLYKIAVSKGITLYSLRRANNKWDNIIYPGQTLLIPGSSATAASASSAGSATGSAVISYTQSDLDLLARLITAEADGQPYNAQVGVGAVVVNRVQDSRYPHSISGVIYQVDGGYYQFTPVENGYINKPATETAKKAAYDALHGVDPSNGALYYFDDSATNKWLWSKPIKAYIGRMVFVS